MPIRVLLDECIPVQVISELRGEVRTVRGMRWRGKKNGELLDLADAHFEVFITMDGALTEQQRISGRRLGVVSLVAPSNEIESLRPLIVKLRHAVLKVKPGQVIRLRK